MDLSSSVAGIERAIAFVSPAINKVVVVILILLMGFIVGKLLGRFLHWSMRSLKVDDQARLLFKRQVHMTRWTSNIVSLAVYVVTVYLVLKTIGIVQVVLGIILAVVILLALISLVAGLKDLFPNAIAGFSVRKQYREGDVMVLAYVRGKVRRVGVLQTEIVLKNGDAVLVPHVAVRKKMPQHRGRG